MAIRHRLVCVVCVFAVCLVYGSDLGAQSSTGGDDPAPRTSALPSTEWLRVRFDVIGANYWDYSQAQLGHETQGRIGWAIIGLSGTITPYLSYEAELNPVNDSARPEPACGEKNFFYPNAPDPNGPPVACVADGRNRVDLYRFVGLDPLTQQNAVRIAVIDVHTPTKSIGVRAGRFVEPLGFGWQELGSWTNEDATLIQRLDADATFGAELYGRIQRHGKPFVRLEGAFVRGDNNRDVEYSYSAFVAPDEDTNSGATGVGRVTVTPMPGLDVRVSGKYGYSGSKVESYPSFYLTKRNDKAAIGSVQYCVNRYVRGFGEYARYVSGLPATSEALIDAAPEAVIKRGYYAGAEATIPLPKAWEGMVSFTHEDLSRNDSLVWYMQSLGLYNVHLGAHVRSNIVRFSVRPVAGVEFGAYWNHLTNPYPWLSGIEPVSGPDAYLDTGEGRPKYRVIFRVRIP